jgi:hypothetical protein
MPAMIDDVTTAALRSKVAEAMVRMASQGSVPAATAVLKLLDDVEQKALADEHAAALAGGDTVALCRYLGGLGATKKDVEQRIGRAMTRAEEAAYLDGKRDRQLEVRAIELGQVRRGTAKVQRWMQK